MGEASGSAARAWHRRRRDQRLGYSALALGAGGFVLVLAGTLVVTEVVPGLLDDEPRTQEVVPASELRPQDARPAPAPAAPVQVAEGSVIVPATAPAAQPEPPGEPEQPGGETPQPAPSPGPEQPGPEQPGPGPAPGPEPEGPVGSVVDPVVEAVAGTADGLTGGATAPLTSPVVGLVDGLTDVVDGILTLRRDR